MALLAISTSDGAQTTQREFACPIDGKKFTSTTVTTKNERGGADSDFCTYELGPQALPNEVHTCPACGFSATTTEFEQRMPQEMSKTIQETLAKWKDKNKVADWTTLPVWQRYELAALCGFLKFKNSAHAAALYHRAAWSARQEAVAKGTAKMDLRHPLSAIELTDMLRTKLKAEADKNKQAQIRFTLAQLSHRAGMGAQRDALLVELAKVPQGVTGVKQFRDLVNVEKKYLKLAAEHYARSIKTKEVKGNDVGFYDYLIGDIHRRCGNNVAARAQYDKAEKCAGLRADIKELIEFVRMTFEQGEGFAEEE